MSVISHGSTGCSRSHCSSPHFLRMIQSESLGQLTMSKPLMQHLTVFVTFRNRLLDHHARFVQRLAGCAKVWQQVKVWPFLSSSFFLSFSTNFCHFSCLPPQMLRRGDIPICQIHRVETMKTCKSYRILREGSGRQAWWSLKEVVAAAQPSSVAVWNCYESFCVQMLSDDLSCNVRFKHTKPFAVPSEEICHWAAFEKTKHADLNTLICKISTEKKDMKTKRSTDLKAADIKRTLRNLIELITILSGDKNYSV